MAWYALYEWFSKFRKKPYVNQIQAYRQYLFDKWFDELTDEQRLRYLKNKESKKKQRINETKQFLWLADYIISKGEYW